jgi:hypothetical protein
VAIGAGKLPRGSCAWRRCRTVHLENHRERMGHKAEGMNRFSLTRTIAGKQTLKSHSNRPNLFSLQSL